jgi:hypothetical protein
MNIPPTIMCRLPVMLPTSTNTCPTRGVSKGQRSVIIDHSPMKIHPVASRLVYAVPSWFARRPPNKGVHVLFKLNADSKRLNWALLVPISRPSFDFNGPIVSRALEVVNKNHKMCIGNAQVSPDGERAHTYKSDSSHDGPSQRTRR